MDRPRSDEADPSYVSRSWEVTMFFAIRFDDVLFVSIEALVDHCVDWYGSLYEVPEDHPQHAIIEGLALLNPEYYEIDEGEAIQKLVL